MRTHLRKTPHFFSYYKYNASEKCGRFFYLHVSSIDSIFLLELLYVLLIHLFTPCYWSRMSFPGGSVVIGSTYQCRRHQFSSWVGKIPCRREWQPTPVFLPGESHGQRVWQVSVHRVDLGYTKHLSPDQWQPWKEQPPIHSPIVAMKSSSLVTMKGADLIWSPLKSLIHRELAVSHLLAWVSLVVQIVKN